MQCCCRFDASKLQITTLSSVIYTYISVICLNKSHTNCRKFNNCVTGLHGKHLLCAYMQQRSLEDYCVQVHRIFVSTCVAGERMQQFIMTFNYFHTILQLLLKYFPVIECLVSIFRKMVIGIEG